MHHKPTAPFLQYSYIESGPFSFGGIYRFLPKRRSRFHSVAYLCLVESVTSSVKSVAPIPTFSQRQLFVMFFGLGKVSSQQTV